MTVYFADSSALARTYLSDEPGSEALMTLLVDSGNAVMASALVDVEVSRALAAALRHGRIDAQQFAARVQRYRRDAGNTRAILRIALDPATVLPRARQLVLDHEIRTLDALHLAVAETDGRALAEGEQLVFVTRDERQRKVAEALGMATA